MPPLHFFEISPKNLHQFLQKFFNLNRYKKFSQFLSEFSKFSVLGECLEQVTEPYLIYKYSYYLKSSTSSNYRDCNYISNPKQSRRQVAKFGAGPDGTIKSVTFGETESISLRIEFAPNLCEVAVLFGMILDHRALHEECEPALQHSPDAFLWVRHDRFVPHRCHSQPQLLECVHFRILQINVRLHKWEKSL